MTNSTISVKGGALPAPDRAAIMTRAWAIFRETYHYPQIKFSSIGRPCFNACLRQAWAEAKNAARVAAIPAAEKSTRIAFLLSAIEIERFNSHWPAARTNIAAMRAEVQRLA
jgi:hypothetical protein